MINWDIIKIAGVLYIIIALILIGIVYSISLMINVSLYGFWVVGLFFTSIYWGAGFTVALFEN